MGTITGESEHYSSDPGRPAGRPYIQDALRAKKWDARSLILAPMPPAPLPKKARGEEAGERFFIPRIDDYTERYKPRRGRAVLRACPAPQSDHPAPHRSGRRCGWC